MQSCLLNTFNSFYSFFTSNLHFIFAFCYLYCSYVNKSLISPNKLPNPCWWANYIFKWRQSTTDKFEAYVLTHCQSPLTSPDKLRLPQQITLLGSFSPNCSLIEVICRMNNISRSMLPHCSVNTCCTRLATRSGGAVSVISRYPKCWTLRVEAAIKVEWYPKRWKKKQLCAIVNKFWRFYSKWLLWQPATVFEVVFCSLDANTSCSFTKQNLTVKQAYRVSLCFVLCNEPKFWQFILVFSALNRLYLEITLFYTTPSGQIISSHVTWQALKCYDFFGLYYYDTIGLWLAQVSEILLKYHAK